MRKHIKQWLLGLTIAACVASTGVALGVADYSYAAADDATHSLTISSADWDASGAYKLVATGLTRTNVGDPSNSLKTRSGIRYALDTPRSMAGKTGLAFRVKNDKDVDQTLYQFVIYSNDSVIQYHPYAATIEYYGVDGTVQTKKGSTRQVYVPANFDGWMMIPFDQMTIVKHSDATSQIWTNTDHLSVDGEGDWGMPTSTWSEIDIYMENGAGTTTWLGANTTYVKGDDGAITLDEYSYMNLSTKKEASSGQGMVDVYRNHSMDISISDSDLNANTYAISLQTEAKTSIMYDLEDGTLPLADQDGIAIRVKNLTGKQYALEQFRFHIDGSNLVYSNFNATPQFYSIDGTYTTTNHGQRYAFIPVGFDGWLLMDYNDLTVIRHSDAAEGTWVWTYKDPAQYNLSETGEGDFAMPTGNLKSIAYYPFGESGLGEFLIGGYTTYTVSENNKINFATQYHIDPDTVRASSGSTPIPNVNLAVPVKFNISAGENATVESHEVTLKYGESYTIPATIPAGYLTKVMVGDQELSSLTINHTYKNVTELNVVVSGDAMDVPTFTVGEESISLADKKGIKLSVDNTNGTQLDYVLKITDGSKFYNASSAGAGLFETEDGAVYYGNVFSIPAGFKGNIYVPFNVWRGGTYGAPQNLPFDYVAASDKPATVTNKVYIDNATEQERSAVEAIFSNIEYVAELPGVTKPATANANLYKNGDADFVNALYAVAKKGKVATQAGSGSTWAIAYNFAEGVSFHQAGLAIRFKNLTGADYGIRAYFEAGGKIYVPQAKNAYALINADGTVVEKTDTNRNMIMPAGFDGTIIINFADFATDNIAEGVTQNVIRNDLSVTRIRFYIGCAENGAAMYGKAAWIGYDGTLSGEITYSPSSAVSLNSGSNVNDEDFDFDTLAATALTNGENGKVLYNGAEATSTIVAPAGKAYEITVTPDIGYEAIVKAGETTLEATEGKYTVPAATEAISVTYNQLKAKLTASVGENGTATLDGAALTSGEQELAQGVKTLVVTPAKGYAATVKLGDETLVAGENGYTITLLGDATLTITFEQAVYTITYNLDRGVNADTNPATYTSADTVTFAPATKEGYEFLGWYVREGENETLITGIEAGSTGDIEVYAKFELIADIGDSVVEESGCKSTVGLGLAATALVVLGGAALVIKKKED